MQKSNVGVTVSCDWIFVSLCPPTCWDFGPCKHIFGHSWTLNTFNQTQQFQPASHDDIQLTRAFLLRDKPRRRSTLSVSYCYTSWYGFSFERVMKTKSVVFGGSCFTQWNWKFTTGIQPHIHRQMYVRYLSSYWHKETRDKDHTYVTAFTKNGGGFQIIVLCGVFLGLLTNSEKLK